MNPFTQMKEIKKLQSIWVRVDEDIQNLGTTQNANFTSIDERLKTLEDAVQKLKESIEKN